VADGHHVLIISGAYGVVLANEGIGWYDKRLRLLDWPQGLLESCILDYARRQRVASILALVARTGPYVTLMHRIRAVSGPVEVRILSPIVGAGEGAQGKVPRAQGQAVSAILGGDWDESWFTAESTACVEMVLAGQAPGVGERKTRDPNRDPKLLETG
jgi:hypothetical protein